MSNPTRLSHAHRVPPAAVGPSRLSRRRALRLAGVAATVPGLVVLGGCDSGGKWNSDVVAGTSPSLKFTMTRASDGKEVTAADYRGRIVMLYFGYTFCPDVCPTTLQNVSTILHKLGDSAKDVRFVFVTVDPGRDTLDILKQYVGNFAPEVEGLRGTPDQIASLARRFRVAYSVTPESKDHPYVVTHSSAIYVFDGTGAARLLVTSLGTEKPDLDGTEADLRRLVEEGNPPGLLQRLMRLI